VHRWVKAVHRVKRLRFVFVLVIKLEAPLVQVAVFIGNPYPLPTRLEDAVQTINIIFITRSDGESFRSLFFVTAGEQDRLPPQY
jgi:hypothetical protein